VSPQQCPVESMSFANNNPSAHGKAVELQFGIGRTVLVEGARRSHDEDSTASQLRTLLTWPTLVSSLLPQMRSLLVR
jgi:hypothetical protein